MGLMCSSAGRRKPGPGEAEGSMTGVDARHARPKEGGWVGGLKRLNPALKRHVSRLWVFGVFVFASRTSRGSARWGRRISRRRGVL